MELILLKSSVCLLSLLLFYKIALEPLSVHKFKRVYLLVAVAIAAIIPFITFVKYVEPTFDASPFIFDTSTTIPLDANFKIVEETNYLPIILWSIYALGAGLFFIRFCVNLFQIVSKIRKHTKIKSKSFINVLMEHLEIPHTFFNFIFLNKNKFENNQIPAEVLLHEQTHAKQKHSLDIIIIELLQVVFWFNPLLHWLKKEVKLNHEFLADQEVLNQGVDTKNYQNILLQFSSNQQEVVLANAINYSSIKKRFTLMNTQTSTKTKWLRSLLLLPLLALLLYSFSSTKEVENELTPAMLFQDEKEVNTRQNTLTKQIKDDLEKIGELKINYLNQDTKLIVNGIECDGCVLNLTKKGIAQLILSTTNKEEITNFKIKIPGVKTLFNKSNIPNDETRQYIVRAKKGDIIQVFDIKTKSNKFKPVIIKVVDKNDEEYSNSPKVKKGEASSIPPPPPPPPANPNATPEDKAKQEKVIEKYNKENKITNGKVLRNPPPPPPPVSIKTDENTGFIEINDEQHFYATIDGKTKYYNRWGIEVDSKGTKLSSTQTDGSKVIAGQKITKIYKDGKVVTEFKKTWEDDDLNIPPPPPPAPKTEQNDKRAKLEARRNEIMSKRQEKLEQLKNERTANKKERLEQLEHRKLAMIEHRKKVENITPPPPPISTKDHVINMAKKGASFYYNGDAITSDKAIDLTKNNSELNISSNTNNGVSTVHISEKAIQTLNGRIIDQKNAPNTAAVNESKTTNLSVNADNSQELKAFDWKALPIIFKSNNPEEIITLSFSLDHKVKFENSVIDNFNFTISDRTSELNTMISKSKKAINKLSSI